MVAECLGMHSIMGKQSNKILKRKRRKEYLRRVKDKNNAAKNATGSKPAAKKPAKKAAPKADAKPAPAAKKEAPAKKAAAPAKKKAASKGDDLKKIEGIGPKAAEALVNAGIDSFAKLAKAEPAKIKEILVEASSRLAHLEPATWPQQSELAAAEKWDELKVLQDKLDGGK